MENKIETIESNRQKKGIVLVIDDEEIVHVSIRKVLSRLGFDVDAVFSANEGLSRLRDCKYDLAIVDLMMPRMNGIQFLETLKEQGMPLPVLMVTGYPTIGTAVQALRLGAMDYIAKPFTRKELIGPVQRALSHGEEDLTDEPQNVDQPITIDELLPGNVVALPRHAWAKFQQDGTFLIGIEKSFLRTCGTAVALSIPDEMDLVEQGYVGIYLENNNGEEHGVAMPLSGQVVATNGSILSDLNGLGSDTWLLRIIPSHLEQELGRLAQQSKLQKAVSI